MIRAEKVYRQANKYGWIASNTVLYVASGFAIVFLIYTAISEVKLQKEAKTKNK